MPRSAATREKLWHLIETELSVNKFTPTARAAFVDAIHELQSQDGVQCVILGCTEIPLLVSQKDTKVPLIDTTRVHVRRA